MSVREAVNVARDAADTAHEIERAFLHIAEAVRRGAKPDRLTVGLIPRQIERLTLLLELTGVNIGPAEVPDGR